MKKNFIIIFAIAIQVLLHATSATAQTVTDSIYYKMHDHYGRFITRITDTVARPMRYRIQTSTNSTYTSGVFYTSWNTIMTTVGTTIYTDSAYGTDTNRTYARVQWDTLSGPSHNTAGLILQTPATITVTRVRTTIKFFTTVTIFSGNGTLVVTGTLSPNSTFTGGTAPLGPVRTITGITPVVVSDSTDTLSSGTPFWLRYVGTGNFFGPVTVILVDTTLTPLPVPTGADSVVTVGITAYTRRIKCNTYGLAGYAKAFLYDSATLALIDTQTVLLSGSMSTQSPLFVNGSLTPTHGYISKVNIHDAGGDVWLVADTFTTLPMPVIPVTFDSAKYIKLSGHYGKHTFYMHDTAAVAFRYQIQTNTNSTFTGIGSITAWKTVTLSGAGVFIDSVNNPDTMLDYARVIWNKIGSSTYDTTAPVRMYRMPYASLVSMSRTMTSLAPTISGDSGNDSITVSGIFSTDSGFISTYPMGTHVFSGYLPTTWHDSIPYVLTHSTTYWIKYTFTNRVGTYTLKFKDSTLPPAIYPYLADFGPVTIGPTNYNRHIVCDLYGGPGYSVEYRYSFSGTLLDTTFAPLTSTVGPQYPNYPHTGLTPLTSYISKVKVHNLVGDTWKVDTITTLAAPSVLAFWNDTVVKTSSDVIHIVTRYTTVSGGSADMMQYVHKVGDPTPLVNPSFGLPTGTGIVTWDFVATTPGTYIVYTNGDDGTSSAYTDSVLMTISAPTNSLSTSADSAYAGDSITVSYSALNADTSSLTNSETGTTDGVLSTGTMRVRINATTTFTFVSSGITTVTKTKTVYVKARPVDTTGTHTGVTMVSGNENEVRMYPNPAVDQITVATMGYIPNTQLEVYDIAGRPYLSSAATSTETNISVANFPNGIYILHLVQSGKMFKEIRFIVQH